MGKTLTGIGLFFDPAVRSKHDDSTIGQPVLNRFRLNYRLVVRSAGHVEVRVGSVSPRFLAAVRDVVRLHAIGGGTIECRGRGRHARLVFTAGFPARGRQAIRNAWQPPTGPGPGGGRRVHG